MDIIYVQNRLQKMLLKYLPQNELNKILFQYPLKIYNHLLKAQIYLFQQKKFPMINHTESPSGQEAILRAKSLEILLIMSKPALQQTPAYSPVLSA